MKYLKIALFTVFSVLPCAAYFFALYSGGAMELYGFNLSPLVWVLCVLCAVISLFIFVSREVRSEEEVFEEEYDNSDYQLSEREEAVQDERLTEEYSEFYSTAEGEEPIAYVSPDIAGAIAAQKAEVENESADEAEDFWQRFIEKSEEKNSAVSNIYEDIPDTLPEGFSFVEEDEDEEEYEDEPFLDEQKKSSMPGRIIAGVCCVLCIGAAGLLGYNFTGVDSHGVYKNGTFYKWSQVETVTVSAPLLSQSRIDLTVILENGETAEILGGTTVMGKDYDSIDMCARLCRFATAGGAEKHVKDKKQLEENFKNSEKEQTIYEILN